MVNKTLIILIPTSMHLKSKTVHTCADD